MRLRTFLLAGALALAATPPFSAALAQQTLNIRDADIRAFIQDAARVTQRTFIIDNRVQGKVSVVTDRPLSRSEYFEVFLSTLRANGLVAVPTAGGAYRIQPVEGAAGQPGTVGRATNRNSFVTEIFRLRNIDAATTLETLRPLVSKDGSVTANRAGNSIVVADYADNIQRIRAVIRRIDQSNDDTQVVTLKNANAAEIAASLGGLTGAPGAQGGPTASVVAVASANAIAIRGDPATVARLAAVARELDTKAKSGTEIRVVFLENADAAQLLPVLQQLVGQTPDAIEQSTLSRSNFGTTNSNASGTNTNLVSTQATPQQTQAPGGSGGANQPALTTQGGRTAAVVTRFAGANAIVIAAPPDIQRQLADVIRQLDTRRAQVLVEAIVAEVSDATVNRLGAQFLLGNTDGGAFAASTFSNSSPNILQLGAAIGARQLATSTTTINGSTVVTGTNTGVSDTLAQSAIQSVLGTSGGFGGFGGKIGSTIFGAIINAVKSDTQSNLLQVPHILTLDNTEARLLSGQEIPITTGQALSSNFDNAFRTTQRENVGIQLEVKPQINSSGSIKLFIHQQVSSIAGPVASDNSDLVLNKREVETTLTVDDGAIAVIGGLLSDDERRTIEKIPLLGDIPVVGALFRSKARQRTKTNLMVFIRPTILRSRDDSQRLTEQRYGYLRAQQMYADPDREPSLDTLVRDYLDAIPPGATPLPADSAGEVVVGPPGAPVTTVPPPGEPVVIPLQSTTTSTVIRPVEIAPSNAGKRRK